MAKGKEILFPDRTARFRQIVDRCGRPDVHLSLVAPARDRELQELARRGRVLTVQQAHRGQGTDHGVVGVFPVRGVQFLVFSRSLKPFVGKRIVGIDYSLLNHPPGTNTKKETAARFPTVRASPKQRQPRSHAGSPKDAEPTSPPKLESPPGPIEIKAALRRLESLLAGKHYARARTQLQELLDRMAVT